MQIITHRGLDFDSHHSYTESSKEAFTHFLNEGFGIEFDVRITKDSIPVISHDESLARLTNSEQPNISDITASDFENTTLPKGHPLLLTELIELLKSKHVDTPHVHALHLKCHNQTHAGLDILIPYLAQLSDLPIIIFDATADVAKLLKEHIPTLSLAASVSHSYDIQRYNNTVGGTLVNVDEIKNHTDIYDWVWLDEWDLTAEDNERKTLYNEKTIFELRTLGYKIAIVSPELHGTSPKLLGGESHEDAHDITTLKSRWNKLIALKPDALCTDYPYTVTQLLL